MVNDVSIVIHGKGGQGAVKASKLLAFAASLEGKNVQAFPFFGTEREGSPVEAYCRISDKKIWSRNDIVDADYAIVLDKNLFEVKQIIAKKIFLNANKNDKECKPEFTCYDASDLAMKIFNKNIANTAMLALFCRETKLISYENLISSLNEFFSGENLRKNIQIINVVFNK